MQPLFDIVQENHNTTPWFVGSDIMVVLTGSVAAVLGGTAFAVYPLSLAGRSLLAWQSLSPCMQACCGDAGVSPAPVLL
jgi:hypothetical protein